MELRLETFRKTANESNSEEIGQSRITIGQAEYRELERLEKKLKDSDENEMMIDLTNRDVEIETPDASGELKDTKVRLFLDEEAQAGLFHVVAKSAMDDSLIYTEPSLVRMVAL